MNVNEIFSSIDGEGLRSGALATFVRLSGCNLRCSYCDTAYAQSEDSGTEMSAAEIIDICAEYGNRHITLTGGEPLLHPGAYDLVRELTNNGYIVNIETNGSLDIEPYLINNVIITMDYKTPFSLMNDRMLTDNIERLRECDILKIVCAETDFDDISELIRKYKIKSGIYLSPVFGMTDPPKLVEFLKALNRDTDTENIRIQLQMHKIIWDPDKRGV